MGKYFSIHINCKRCGSTNRYFHSEKQFNKKYNKYYLVKMAFCVECWREKKKEILRRHQKTEAYKIKRKEYDKNNREKINGYMRMRRPIYKFREKAKKEMKAREEAVYYKQVLAGEIEHEQVLGRTVRSAREGRKAKIKISWQKETTL